MAHLMSSMDGSSSDAISGLLDVCFPDVWTTLDVTYGNGNFWKGDCQPTFRGDILHERAKDCVFDYRALPFLDRSIDVVIFDPPYQPTTTSKKEGKTARQFRTIAGGIEGVKQEVVQGAREAFRVGRLGCIIKVQDYIHSHKPVWMTKWVWDTLGEPYDFLTLRLPNKMIAANWTKQKSVWRNHSTFYVYRHKSLR